MSAVADPGYCFGARLRDGWARFFASRERRGALVLALLVAFGLVWGALVAYAAIGAAVLALSFVACLAVLRDFRVGVMLLIAIMPISWSVLFPHAMFGITGLQPLNLLIAVTLAVFLMRAIGTGMLRGFLPRPLLLLYVAPIVAAGLVGMEHVKEIPTLFKAAGMIYFDTKVGYLRDMMLKPLALVVYAMLVGAAVAGSKKPERFVMPMLVSVFVMASMAVVFVVHSGVSLSALAGEYSRHFMSVLGLHANDLGRLYAVAYALLLFVWDRTRHMALKTALFVGMATVAIALVLTFSRGAFFGFVIVNVIYLLSRRTLKTLILMAVLVPPALMLAPGAFWYRLQTGLGEGWNEITAGRMDDIWIPLMPEVLASPPWGNGIGAIMWSDAMKYEQVFFVAHPHNAYIQAYLDLGIIGTVLLVAFWLHVLVSFWKLARDPRLSADLQGFFEGAGAGLVSFLVAGIAGSSLMPVPEQSFLWLAIGVMYGVRRHLIRAGAGAGPPPARSP